MLNIVQLFLRFSAENSCIHLLLHVSRLPTTEQVVPRKSLFKLNCFWSENFLKMKCLAPFSEFNKSKFVSRNRKQKNSLAIFSRGNRICFSCANDISLTSIYSTRLLFKIQEDLVFPGKKENVATTIFAVAKKVFFLQQQATTNKH